MDNDQYLKTFKKKNSLQEQYFLVLRDCRWHCRNCDSQGINSSQLAGGGGIQGLQRGTKTRPGLKILSENRNCSKCGKVGKWDYWDGTFIEAHPASGISKKLAERIMAYYKYIDSLEQRPREPKNLLIDHRFPMNRWGGVEPINHSGMLEEEIQRKFQLLKKDDSGNHNLLKSRACEQCLDTGKRGYPLGVQYYYAGSELWPQDCPTEGPEAEKGCIGCGWYDIQTWRESLNKFIEDYSKNKKI